MEIERKVERITMGDGKELVAYFHFSTSYENLDAGTIIYYPGGDGNSQKGNSIFMINTLCKNGYKVFTYDFRRSGKSAEPGEPGLLDRLTPEFWRKIFSDSKEFLDWVTSQKGIDPNDISIIGSSLGGALAMSSFLNDNRIKKIISIVPPYCYRTLIVRDFVHGTFLKRLIMLGYRWRLKKEGYRALLDSFAEESPKAKINDEVDYSFKLRIIQTLDDEVVRPEINFYPLQKRLSLPEENILTFDTGGHSLSIRMEESMKKVLEWLTE